MPLRVPASVLSFLCFVALWLCSAGAQAAPKSFGQADTKWHTGDLEAAQSLYEKAIAEGGLEPDEVVIAYSRIGTVKAALKDKAGALSAFRIAASIDPAFELPPDSGPRAKKLYAKARKEASAQDGQKLEIALTAPTKIPARRPFSVKTEIPEGYAVLVSKVVVTVEDPLTGKRWRRRQDSAPSLTFDFPKRAAVSGARLKIRAAATDNHENAWSVATQRTRVAGKRASSAVVGNNDPNPPPPNKKKDKDGILAGPWPWIVGGALVVAGGIVAYAALSSSSEVAVGAPAWR